MPKMHIRKSIQIKAPAEKIFNKLNDFNHWTAWSPWLIQDPEAKVAVGDDAKYYEWEGPRVGSGNMTITGEKANEWIDYDLLFLKPWKSKAKVRFEIKPQSEGAEVAWLMDSSLPFFLFWMKKMMTALIGMDYQRGLNMLKDYIEDGEVRSKLDFKGESSYPGCTYIGIKTNCDMAAIGSKMEEDLGKLGGFLCDREDLIAGQPFSIYHKWDMVNNKVSYTSGIPVKKVPEDLPAGMFSSAIPATKVYTIAHTGPYLHLGNAWTTLYNLQRNKVFKQNKKVHPFEVYISDPEKVAENDLVTEVHFAAR